MKKNKILSAFLSLTLSMTAFGAVPVTASAADTEINVSALNPTIVGATTTTSASVQTAVTNTTTARITHTTTTPPPVTTTSVTVENAKEDKLTAVINIYDDETYEEIKGLHVQFVEYEHDWKNNEEIPEIVRVIADWNTNDTSQMVIENIDSVEGHFYAVKIDEFPEGYCYSWKDHCIQGIHLPFGGTLIGVNKYDVRISHHPPLPKLEYPLDIEREFAISIADMSTNEIVEGLDVELAQMELDSEVVNKYNYVKTIDTWNTSDEPTHSVNVSMHFDSDYDTNYVYGIKINNMPEGYTYRLPDHDRYYIESYYGPSDYQHDLYYERNVTEWDYYIKPDGYNQHYSTTTTTTPAVKTTTTTTIKNTTTVQTTTVPSNENDIIECKAKAKISVIEYGSCLPIKGLDISVSKDGTELFKFNTMETPETVIDISYSTTIYSSSSYQVKISGLPEKYGYENNTVTYSLNACVNDNGKTIDETIILTTPDMRGAVNDVILEDPTFGFYKEEFYFVTDSEKIIPFSNTDNMKVTATIDTPKAEIIETNEKYVILKANEPCSGILTVISENDKLITTKFRIANPRSTVTGITTAPNIGTTTTTTTTTTFSQTEPVSTSKAIADVEITEVTENTLFLKPVGDSAKLLGVSDIYTLSVQQFKKYNSDIEPIVGMKLEITYDGRIAASYPANFNDVQKIAVISNDIKIVIGDANCDGELSMADAVLIMQSIANPAKFGIEGTDENHITEQGKKNADIAGENDGITNADALAIQKKLLKLD